ncbi:hypothetical protein ALC60_03813 [Trachymyrmex zeteki]|uniref:Uncharacterized protein n=1 Tax=Mycetomoellerius zeteki TaxID=64791 RepID=A0A151XA96_9HYME|nr:hypothetical protein ALC60_03813 [Trachymyrmex zeteki]
MNITSQNDWSLFYFTLIFRRQIYDEERAATPGNTLPSRSSKLAPPPVLTWLTLSSVFHLAAHVAVSPPPIIVIVPRVVASTTLSIKLFVPLLKFSNSNTPAGPFHTITFALLIGSVSR